MTSSNELGIFFFLLIVSLTNIAKVLVFLLMSGADDCITVCRQGIDYGFCFWAMGSACLNTLKLGDGDKLVNRQASMLPT